jgi:cytoskeletal protein CcmA (bactofilin family)
LNKEGKALSGSKKMMEYEKRLRETGIPTTRVRGSGKVHIEGMGDVRISGSGFVSPEEIRISGSGSLPGGLKTGRISCSGSVSIDGSAETEEMRFAGSASVAGDIKVKRLSASGSLSVGGDVKGDLVKVAGSCRINGQAELEDTLHVHGSFKVSGDVKAKNMVELHGRFDVNGKIVTRNFEAELRSRLESHVRNGVEAVNVSVEKRRVEDITFFGIPIFGRVFRKGKLYTTDIVAEERVYLENVCCDNVYGGEVIIGEGCVIKGKVEYSESISLHPESKLANPPEKSS